MTGSERTFPEAVKGGYSDEEIAHIYELGRLYLENGCLLQAEVIMHGLNEVCPDFAAAWLATSYISIQNKDHDNAIFAAKQALRINPEFTEATLYLVACLMTTGDYNSAGTYLGEVGEKIDSGGVDNPNVTRFFKAQLARYQNR
jgi:tetratricopeptide (TPR) repeat protein